MSDERPTHDPWLDTTWEGARDAVLRRGRNLSFRQKVMWLEAAHRLSLAMRPPGKQAQPPVAPPPENPTK